MVLKMVFFSMGLWVVGYAEKNHGVLVLNMPRYYHVVGDQHGFMQIPGNPKSLVVEEFGFMYDIPKGSEIEKLYQERLSAELDYFKQILEKSEAVDETKGDGVSEKPEPPTDTGE